MAEFTIAGRPVGAGAPVYIVAEAGVNHNGHVALALKLVEAAAAAGADAVKFQTFSTDALVSRHAPKAAYQKETTGTEGTQRDMLRALELDRLAHEEIMRHCGDVGITFLSTPFDEPSLALLLELGVPAIKVSSTDVTNVAFLERVAGARKPVLLSTGMSTLGEVESALEALERGGADAVVVLHCTSLYPTPPSEANLRAIGTLRRALGRPVGYSDHTEGTVTGALAVALGAVVVEKHLTLDKSLPGPDHRASLSPPEFGQYVRNIREAESSLGDGLKRPRPDEAAVKAVMQKSVVAVRPIRAGEVLTADMLTCKRPAGGFLPADLSKLLGLRALRDIALDEPITWGAVG